MGKQNGKNKIDKGELETIERSASVIAGNARESIYCLSIVGQVEGHYLLPDGQKATKYEQIIPLLVTVEEDDDTDGLLVILNTMGGDVEAGLALAELIASMKKPSVTLVLGEKSDRVRKGDSFSYKPSVQHYLHNTGKTPASVIWVCTPPNF